MSKEQMKEDIFPRDNPFQTPSGYFTELERRILESTQDELPVSKENPFNVPAGYFDALKSNTLTGKHRSDNSAYWITSVAACALVIILLTFNGTEPSQEQNRLSETTTVQETDVLLSYVEDHYLDDIDIIDIQTLIDEEAEEIDLTDVDLSEFFRDDLEVENLINDL